MSVLKMPATKTAKVPEEVIERTNPQEGQFSPSSLSSSQCMRKFYFEKIMKLKSRYTSPPLIYGSAIHKGVESFYQNIGSEVLSFEEVKMQAIQEFTNYWIKYPVMGDEKRTLEGGILTMSKYCDMYKDDITEFEDSDIEGTQWVPMPNGTMLMMKLDRVAQQGPHVGVVDTKTSSWPLTSYFFRNYEQDMQVSMYYYGMMELMGRCDFIMIDAIMVPHPAPKSKSQAFARQNFMRTDYQIEQAVNTYCKVTDKLIAGMNLSGEGEKLDYFHQNQSRCNDYGGCPYKSVCIHGMDHPAIGTDFMTLEQQKEEEDECNN